MTINQNSSIVANVHWVPVVGTAASPLRPDAMSIKHGMLTIAYSAKK